MIVGEKKVMHEVCVLCLQVTGIVFQFESMRKLSIESGTVFASRDILRGSVYLFTTSRPLPLAPSALILPAGRLALVRRDV